MGTITVGTERQRDHVAETVAAACRLARYGEEIGAVHVVTGRRPTYPQLHAARGEAERWGLAVTVAADGAVTMRRPASSAPPRPTGVAPDPPWRWQLWLDRHVAEVRRWARDVRAWEAGFAGLREGTR